MMFDLPTRLVIAYGLITLMALAAVMIAICLRHNSPHRRVQRERARTAERYRLRDEAAAVDGGAAP